MKNFARSDAAGKKRQPIEIEQPLSPDQRRTNDDEPAVDPILLERPPARRSKVDSERLLRILNELAEGGNE